MADEVRNVVRELTGSTASEVRRAGGGDTAEAYTVILDDGDGVFAKRSPASMPGAAEAEAASLNWLADTGTVAVPAVHGHLDGWLVIQHVPQAGPSPEAAEAFGRDLARLHAAGAPAHGSPPTGGPAEAWIGLAPMHNEPSADWPSFYAEHRVRPYLRRAADAGTFDPDEVAVFEQVCDRIEELAGPAEPPARLHGDLWSGNVHWSDQVWLIDPAAHGGHRETDLAMLRLFGCPHLERIIDAYREVSPPAAGWEERVPLHQLFPLLVHAVLFGGGFARQALTAARAALVA
ncbi:fructosamine kinase family protein [Parasphingorhabdus pacifica]